LVGGEAAVGGLGGAVVVGGGGGLRGVLPLAVFVGRRFRLPRDSGMRFAPENRGAVRICFQSDPWIWMNTGLC
jgi:hypothetical protein